MRTTSTPHDAQHTRAPRRPGSLARADPGGLAVATIAAFAGVYHAGWILFDDTAYVVRNPHIARGLSLDGLAWMMQHPHGGNFHPLTSISHMLDGVFGVDPRGPHLVNLALHTANALLVCIVLSRYTGAWWRSAIVAAFFALHPLRVESVAWISERKDVLSTLFFLLTLLAYKRWSEAPSVGRYVVLLVLFVLGLLAKPMLVTVPFVLLLLDVWPLAARALAARRTRLWISVGREAAAASRSRSLSIDVTFVFQRTAGAVMSSQSLSLLPRIENALASYTPLSGMTIAPHDLAIYYPLTELPAARPGALPAAILVLVSVFAWRVRERMPAVLVGWLWYLGHARAGHRPRASRRAVARRPLHVHSVDRTRCSPSCGSPPTSRRARARCASALVAAR